MNKDQNNQAQNYLKQKVLKQLSSINQILCIQGCKAYSLCVTKDCKEPAFICRQERCVCEKSHMKCNVKKLKGIIQTIEKKANSLPSLINENQSLINQMIAQHQLKVYQHKEVIKFLQKQKKQFYQITRSKIQQNTQTLGKIQNFLYKKIKNKRTDEIKGCDIHQIEKELEENPCQPLETQIQIVKQIWRKHKTKVQKFEVELFKELKQFFREKFVFKKFSKSSNVLSTVREVDHLEQVFKDKLIQKYELLYKASQNDFRIAKFKSDCVNIPHTLTLIQTQKGYKFGFYTPQEWKNDESQSKNQKTILISFQIENCQKNYDIINKQLCGPSLIDNILNDCSIIIPDKSNENGCKNQSAYNESDNKTLYEQNFMTKQWQVWKIVFKKQDQSK